MLIVTIQNFTLTGRAGGDWSTTYAPSPFYMTSRMKSVYLEGYDYTVFDLTRRDKVQIQVLFLVLLSVVLVIKGLKLCG